MNRTLKNHSVWGGITFILFICALLTACTTPPASNLPKVSILNETGSQTTSNLMLLVDSSASLNDKLEQPESASSSSKFELEKQLLSRINSLLSKDIQLNIGLRSFGFGSCLNWKSTQSLQPLQLHSPKSLALAISRLNCASGGSPADKALKASTDDLANYSGNKALIFISDGHFTPTSAQQMLQQLKAQYQQQICIYPIWVGNKKDSTGLKNLQNLNKDLCCGFTRQAEQLQSNDALASYLNSILNDFSASKDTDCDGIIDNSPDQCPNTPLNTQVNNLGCQPDNDHDGVFNNQDNCPSTPANVIVDKLGCWHIPSILFKSNQSIIDSKYFSTLNKVALAMLKNPKLSIIISGNTDNIAPFKYNKTLSQKRANAIKKYFNKQSISSKRIKTNANSYSNPVKPNNTIAGRHQNWRAELQLIYP